ncbi:hypothetical protein NP493_315g03008 [Ridgeia piscesae]|uniref:Guanine nucleotide-binding protein subunit gamma n=1 Tax=Ridgeia piscesae TaxID=27915 RepID=A0AAD9NUY5_RIDPI|nr:hypothetical protein NP493_315g03008 [Ridgeia piscesae]
MPGMCVPYLMRVAATTVATRRLCRACFCSVLLGTGTVAGWITLLLCNRTLWAGYESRARRTRKIVDSLAARVDCLCRSCSRRVGVVSPPRPSVRSPPRHVMSGAVAQQRKLVEQLRIECSITRMPLSQTIKAIVAYTEQAKENDPFLCGIDKKENPFMEKGGCAIL